MRWLKMVCVALALCSALVGGPGCGSDRPDSPDASIADAAPIVQGGEPRGDLVVNEVAPQPLSGDDWVELYNRSAQTIDLCGYFLTDSLDRLDHYTPLGGAAPPAACAPLLLQPGAYYLVLADDQPALGVDHARFKLGVADEVHVVTIGGLPMDGLVYLYPDSARGSDYSLARQPDAQGPFHLVAPSPGAANPELQTP